MRPRSPAIGRSTNPALRARRRQGLKVAVADVAADALAEVGAALAKIAGEANVLVVPADVSKLDEVVRLRDRVYEAWGEVRPALLRARARSAPISPIAICAHRRRPCPYAPPALHMR